MKKLGTPLPNSPHATSVSIPKWEDVIGYEEGESRVIDALSSGYPRFVFNPLVVKLMLKAEKLFAKDGEKCLLLPTKLAGLRCLQFIESNSGEKGRLNLWDEKSIYVVTVFEKIFSFAKAYWTHSGDIISSRRAQSLLLGKGDDSEQGAIAKKTVKTRIASVAQVASDDIYLFPSGMGSFFFVHSMMSNLYPGKKTLQLGFPYVDSLKVQQKFGSGVKLSAHHSTLELEDISALFCELPNNPLLASINLIEASSLLRERGIPLIVDDSAANFVNQNVFPYADIAVTSLTKYFSGVGDVMGGALVLNEKSIFYNQFKNFIREKHEDMLWWEDALTLEKNSNDFLSRMEKVNKNGEIVCDYLQNHPNIEVVYYPKYVTKENYLLCLNRSRGGYGGLFSLLLKDSEQNSTRFYDNLDICKGPSFGMNFTIAGPYTLLAHYQELEWAQKYGVNKNLIRFSIGLEEPMSIIKQIGRALR